MIMFREDGYFYPCAKEQTLKDNNLYFAEVSKSVH